jgi:hypothetical protein
MSSFAHLVLLSFYGPFIASKVFSVISVFDILRGQVCLAGSFLAERISEPPWLSQLDITFWVLPLLVQGSRIPAL